MRKAELLLAALVLAAAACDSGGDDGAPARKRTFAEPQAFASAFSDICAGAHDDSLRRFEEIVGDDYGDHEKRAAGAGAVAEIYEDAVDELTALVPPAELRAQVDELLETLTARGRLHREWQEIAADDDLSAEEGITDDALGEANLALAVDSNDVGVDCGIAIEEYVGQPEPPQEAIEVFGTDAELDALAQQCFDGTFASCDALFLGSSDYSTYGSYANCVEPEDRSRCDPPEEAIAQFGEHPERDALATQCYEGQLAACQMLKRLQPYAGYATGCGGRVDDYLGPTCEKALT
jgi:hypothetical protein